MNGEDSRIKELDDLAEFIQEQKTSGKENGYETIDAYQKWRMECLDLFAGAIGIEDPMVKKFASYEREGNGYVLMSNFTPQYPIFKILTRRIQAGETIATKTKVSTAMPAKTIRVFISHASQDVPIVKAFRDDLLIGALNLGATDIFCTTLDGTKVESGEDWRNSIREVVRTAKIHFLIITPYFKESEVCQNEMGGAWTSDGTVLPLIVEPITYDTVGVIQKPIQIEKLADSTSLDRIKDQVIKVLGLDHARVPSDHWTAKKEEFLAKVKGHLANHPPPRPFTRDEFEKIQSELAGARTALSDKIKRVDEQAKLIEDLKLTKDATEVLQVMEGHDVPEPFEEFKTLVADLKKCFTGLDNIVSAIILCNYFRKPFEPTWEEYKKEIDAAVRDEILSEEAEPNSEDSNVRSIHSKLGALGELMDKENKAIEPAYQVEYDSELIEPRLPKFWEKHFDVTVPKY